MSLTRPRIAIGVVLLLLGGCAKDRTRPGLASGDCHVPPCVTPDDRGVGSVDSGIGDSGADAADGG